ncbi:MAG: hypothetical protein UW86_C0001G0019 [Microgenomates group bacterium GW2011_GWA1_Microgenomates_45_10]|nr:MAG: hypothetical protein UW69_C0003G0025 [Microgenomates group bacterium GW2011_GWA2_44_7]KKT77273.1 MAG: hypothetical protein UW73_C0024G0011 [Microgenomates group bacterium GW2011_GWB1_44_8]KKT87466.1 MAG: hypothetical protein UW86_C0001G0019 [Microgenomates group bacterium GW2011_GWA1_Microgenomates_45_10]
MAKQRNKRITVRAIHESFFPEYDQWHSRLTPRIIAWHLHVVEVVYLWVKGKRTYWKHNRTTGTCRHHAKTEFGDLMWLTADIVWMVTKIELPIVSQKAFQRIWDKMEERKQLTS